MVQFDSLQCDRVLREWGAVRIARQDIGFWLLSACGRVPPGLCPVREIRK